jgi:hypothetical protein
LDGVYTSLGPVYRRKTPNYKLGRPEQSAEKKYRTEMVANDLVLLGSREKRDGTHEKATQLPEQLVLLRSRTMIFRFDSALLGSLRVHCNSMAHRFQDAEVLALL